MDPDMTVLAAHGMKVTSVRIMAQLPPPRPGRHRELPAFRKKLPVRRRRFPPASYLPPNSLEKKPPEGFAGPAAFWAKIDWRGTATGFCP
jgi:hypothetical protein